MYATRPLPPQATALASAMTIAMRIPGLVQGNFLGGAIMRQEFAQALGGINLSFYSHPVSIGAQVSLYNKEGTDQFNG